MLDRTRSYARTHQPGRAESTPLAIAAALLSLVWLAQPSVALAGADQLYVRLPEDMPAATARRLVSALEAQLADLAPIDLSEPEAERALGIVSIAQAAGMLSIQFADARAEAIGAPRLVSSAASERGASEVASIVRAFVVARLDGERASAAAPEARALPVAETARTPAAQDDAAQRSGTPPAAQESAAQKPGHEPSAGGAQGEPAAAALLAAPDATQPASAPAAAAAQRRGAIDRPDASAAETWRLRLGAAYTGTTYAPELLWQNGLRVDASARVKGPLYLGAGYGYQLPAQVSDGETGVRIRIDAHALNAFLGLGRGWRSFGLACDAGLGAARTVRSTPAPGGTLQATPEVSYWNLVATLRVHARLRFPAAPRLALDLAPALELAPGLGESRVATPDGQENAVLSPHLWRARVDLGAAFDVF